MVEHAVAKVSDIKDGEMKEVAFGPSEAKVLLSKVKGQIYATSHKCTHYGARLVTGVLSNDGRILCPWHGACFNATTGDIEDAPALDNLCKFNVTIKGDDVYVEADEAELVRGRRAPVCQRTVTASNAFTVIIIGGGASGNAAAEKLREDGFNGRIVVISKEDYFPIDRPKLSKSFGNSPQKLAIRNSEFYDNMSITFKLDTSVTSVDPQQKTVTVENNEVFKYDKLIIATGAKPRSIPIPGNDLGNVFCLRVVHDNTKIDQAIGTGEKKNVVIIGSSFIGMEVASIAAKRANVTVVGIEKVPFERHLGEKVGAALKAFHEKNGVTFRLDTGVASIEPSVIDSSKVGSVVLSDNTVLPADVVVVGVGVAPATEFLRSSPGFNLEPDGSLKVDEHLMVEGIDSVYAVGDICRFKYHITGELLRVEHWNFAENTGRAAAVNITNNNSTPFTKVPYFWSAQHGKSLRYAGYASSFDDIIIHGDLDALAFAAYYTQGDKVVAVTTMSKDPIASHSAELLRLHKFPSATEIRNGLDPLQITL
ncbi:4419_t:CDS:10 [Paraglomus brasilianum]|uniref:4419_t:CDS:1 n=1 Tax=Paraglomus brasilianum TaxID=144538 RepID=A0A9N9BJE2_9GLOM|nr:4419_t:CDS:10 [Paraglomus brasilianum]